MKAILDMKTIWKVIAIMVAAGLVLVVLGLSLGAGLNGFYMDKTGVHVIQHNESRITEPLESITNIDVDVSYSNVEFVNSDKYGIDILGYDGNWNWGLENGTLTITQYNKPMLSFLVFNTQDSYVKVYLPKDAELGTVSVKTGSGKVKAGGFRANSMQIRNSYGNVDLYAVATDDLRIDLSSGDFTGTGLSAQKLDYKNSYGKGRFEAVSAGNFTADSKSGDFEMLDCTAGDVKIENSYGKITADGINSSKAYIYASSGDIRLNGEFSGETVIRSSYGDVRFSTSKPKGDYDYDISTRYGKVIFDNERLGNNTSVKSAGSSENSLKIDASSGDIEVYFAPPRS